MYIEKRFSNNLSIESGLRLKQHHFAKTRKKMRKVHLFTKEKKKKEWNKWRLPFFWHRPLLNRSQRAIFVFLPQKINFTFYITLTCRYTKDCTYCVGKDSSRKSVMPFYWKNTTTKNRRPSDILNSIYEKAQQQQKIKNSKIKSQLQRKCAVNG